MTEEDRIRHDERKRIIAQGCIHTRKASENADYDRPDLSAWQEDQSEYFDPVILGIVAEYAAWRDKRAAAAIQSRDEEIARYRTALTLIEKAETEVFDEGDTEEWVIVSMDMDEASRIATVALLGCTCMEVFGENPDCPAHGRAALEKRG